MITGEFLWKKEREMRKRARRGVWIGLLLSLLLVLGLSPLQNPKINLNKPAVIEQRHATWDEKKKNKQIAKLYAATGWGWRGREWLCLHDLWTRESRFDHFAKNPSSSAFGIAQLLGEKDTRPRVQILRGASKFRSCKSLQLAGDNPADQEC